MFVLFVVSYLLDNNISELRAWLCNKGKTFEHTKFGYESVLHRDSLVKDSDDSIKALSDECLKADESLTQTLANYKIMKEYILWYECLMI